MRDLNEIRQAFTADRFATDLAKIRIVSASPDSAVCEMPITPEHLNARGTVMGGAIFTLADFTAAVAANAFAEETNTISLHADITYLSAPKGSKLIAAASCIRQGRTTALHSIEIRDDLDTLVAHACMNGYVLQSPPPTSKK